MKKIIFCLATIFVCMLSGVFLSCEKDTKDTIEEELLFGKWDLEKSESMDGEILFEPSPDQTMSIIFHSNHTLDMMLYGCIYGSGTWNLDGNNLTADVYGEQASTAIIKQVTQDKLVLASDSQIEYYAKDKSYNE